MTDEKFFNALFKVKQIDKAFIKQINAFNYTLTSDDFELVEKTLELRNIINFKHKKFNEVSKYKRDVDLNEISKKGLLGEIALNNVLFNLFKSSQYNLKCPPLVQFNVDKNDFDFTISNENFDINFELKTQDINIKYNTKYLCFNEQSFLRQTKNKDNNLYIACLLNDKQCYFFMFNKKYFDENKIYKIAKSNDNYYVLELNKIIENIVK